MALTATRPRENRVSTFLRDTFEELRKVVWPTPAELYRYTIVVIVTVLIIALFIGAADYAVGEVAKRYIYNGIK